MLDLPFQTDNAAFDYNKAILLAALPVLSSNRITAGSTEGAIADITAAPGLLAAMPPARCLIADKGYDANSLRDALGAQGTEAVIPPTASRKTAIPYDAIAYRERHMIERAICSLKDNRLLATR